MSGRTLRALAVAAALSIPASVFADADSAKKYLQQAQSDATAGNMPSAKTNLQLAEAELDGVDAAAKDPIAKDIATLKQSMADTQGAAASEETIKRLDSMLQTVKDNIPNPHDFVDVEKEMLDELAKSDVKAAIGAEREAKYRKQVATFHKVWAIQAMATNLAQAKQQLDNAEQDWPEQQKVLASPNGDHNSAERTFGYALQRIGELVKPMPADNADAKPLIARYEKLNTAFNNEILKGKAAETLASLQRGWALYEDDRAGWDKETAGPSFDDMLHNQGDVISKFNAPKTVAMVSRASNSLDEWLKADDVRESIKIDPKIKSFIDEVRATQKAGFDKLAGFASTVLDQAEKTPMTKETRDRLETLANDDLRLALEGAPQYKPLQARALKLVGAFDQKNVGDAAAQQKLYDALVAQASKAWPGIVEKLNASESLDAVGAAAKIDNFKGKTVLFKNVSNRMGWDYSPGNGYDFATTIDGVPVAGKYDPAIRKAFNQITAKTGKDFSNDNCDVIAEVEGAGPIVKIARSEGSLQTTGGEKVATITAQADETVIGIRLKVIALHVGPLAATTNGAVDENGNVQ